MNKYFVPKKESKELQQLGFDEDCLAFYNGNFLESTEYDFDSCNSKEVGLCTKAPTFSQAFRWFREKYELDSFVNAEWKQMVKVGYYFNAGDYYSPQPNRLTYEEAELECLRKLIELVK